MLTRDQVYILLMLRARGDNVFSSTSRPMDIDVIRYISEFGQDPENRFACALRLAASGIEESMVELVKMIETTPDLLLQAGNVVTRGGVSVTRTTLYEFFLLASDPAGAKRIEFGFGLISNGEAQRRHQYERCKPHIDALAEQIKSGRPMFDLKPLIELIKESAPADVRAALAKDMTHASALRDALVAFRKAVRPPKKTVGMHYKHYTTLQQGLDLLYGEWQALSDGDRNNDKCKLVERQIIGYLERSLPTVDRMAFAQGFYDGKRSLEYKYNPGSFYPDCAADADDSLGVLEQAGLGFDYAIYNAPWLSGYRGGIASVAIPSWKKHIEQKQKAYSAYAATTTGTNDRACNFLR